MTTDHPAQVPNSIHAITLVTEDLAGAVTFYQEVFGLEKHYADESSTVFKFGPVLINLLSAASAPELVEPAPVGAPEGVRAVFTIEVEDVDAVCAALAERGVSLLNGPMDRPWGIRTASFRDPAGHGWEIAH